MTNHIPKSYILIYTENALGTSEAMVNSILLHGSINGSGVHPASYKKGNGESPKGTKQKGLQLTIHLYLVPRLRMYVAIYSLPLSSWHGA
jgi:hypothetical protein